MTGGLAVDVIVDHLVIDIQLDLPVLICNRIATSAHLVAIPPVRGLIVLMQAQVTFA